MPANQTGMTLECPCGRTMEVPVPNQVTVNAATFSQILCVHDLAVECACGAVYIPQIMDARLMFGLKQVKQGQLIVVPGGKV